jgi:hypothetical protein
MPAWRLQRISRQFAAAALLIAVFIVSSDLRSQETLADGVDFNALLRAKIKITQEGEGIAPSARQFTLNFRKSPGVVILLDRRVDPDAPLTIDQPEMRLEWALREVALKQKMGLVIRTGFVYFAPQELCRWWPGQLDAIEKRVDKLPAKPKQFWQAEAKLAWQEGAIPRELASLIGGAPLGVEELEKIPHDIWAAFEGPQLPRWERLAIICAGFDLVPEIAATGEVTLKPLIAEKTITSSISVLGAQVSDVMENARRYFPEARLSPRQGKLTIEGSFGEIEAIRAWVTPPTTTRKTAPKKTSGPVMVLNSPIAVPANKLLERLSQGLKCELVVASDVSAEAISKTIQPSWTGTRDELLKKISEEILLKCEFRDGKIVVSNP